MYTDNSTTFENFHTLCKPTATIYYTYICICMKRRRIGGVGGGGAGGLGASSCCEWGVNVMCIYILIFSTYILIYVLD